MRVSTRALIAVVATGATGAALFAAPGAIARSPIKQAPPGTTTSNPTSVVAGSLNNITLRWTAKAPVTTTGTSLTFSQDGTWSPFQVANKGTPGFVSLQKGTCTATGITVGPNSVTVNDVKCSKANQWVQLAYYNAAPTVAGPSIFNAQLSTAPGTIMPTTVTVSAAAVASLAYLQHASNVVAGAVMAPPVQVRALDAFGNLASTTITLAFTPGTSPVGAVLGGTTSKPTVNGVASFSNLTVNKVGTGYSLDASAGAAPTVTDATPFDVTAGAPASLTVEMKPTDVLPADGSAQTVAVATVKDAFGNGVPGVGITILKDVTNDVTVGGTFIGLGGQHFAFVQASLTKSSNTIIAHCTSNCGTITDAQATLTEVAAGDWLGAGYGTNGYVMNNYGTCCFGDVDPAVDFVNLPTGITYSDSDPHGYAWHDFEVLNSDGVLYTPAGTPQGSAYASYSAGAMTFELTFNSSWHGDHAIRLYIVDPDESGGGRVETISGTSAANGPFGFPSASGFAPGRWVQADVTIPAGGDVITFTVTNNNGGSNAVLSGIFVD